MSSAPTALQRDALLAQLIAGKFPDQQGRYGPFGGRFVPETLVPAHERLEQGVRRWLADEDFQRELQQQLTSWAGRPTALSHAPQLSRRRVSSTPSLPILDPASMRASLPAS